MCEPVKCDTTMRQDQKVRMV